MTRIVESRARLACAVQTARGDRTVDVRQAQQEGLPPPAAEPVGGSWDDLFADGTTGALFCIEESTVEKRP